MKVVCLKENLKNSLLIAERVLGKNQTLPILGNFLLTTEKGALKISSTDLEVGVRCWVSCKIEKEGSVSVSGKLFTSFINNLSDTKITLESKNNSLNVSCGKQKTTIVGLDVEEFPIIPEPNNTQKTTLRAGFFREALLQIINAAATNDARLELQSVYINIRKDGIKAVSTDSFRLAEKTILNKENEATTLIIPIKTAHELSRLLEGKEEITIFSTKNQALFKTENIEFFSRLIEGSYPDYEQIIPKQNETSVEVKRDDFISSLKTASLFSGKTNDVKISIEPSKKEITVFSADSDKGDFISELPAVVTGAPQKISFNARFFLDGLSNIKEDVVILELNGESSPTIMRGKDMRDYFYLIMPIRSV